MKRDVDRPSLGLREVAPTACLFLVLSLIASPALAAQPDPAPSDLRFERRVDAPFAAVWATLMDFESWPAFIPALDSIECEREGDDRWISVQTAAKLGYRVRYQVVIRAERERGRIDLALDPRVKNDIEAFRNVWQVTAQDDGTTRVELTSVFRSGLLPDFLEERIVRRSVEAAVDAVALEIARRQFEASSVALAAR